MTSVMKEGTLLGRLERLFFSLRAGCLFWWPAIPLFAGGMVGGGGKVNRLVF